MENKPGSSSDKLYYDITLTDFQFHHIEPRKPLTFGRSVLRSIRNGQPGRVHTTDFSVSKDGKITFRLRFPLEDQKRIAEAQKQGKTIRILMPKNGVPVFWSKDLIEFLQAPKNRHILDSVLKSSSK